jgi:LytS/YehU family sensor histidine kinase
VITFEQRLVAIIFGSILLNTLILIMHNSVILYHKKNDAEIENAQLKAANAEANNLLLKQQIQPHFLFNALNVLKSLYKKDANAGDAYIVHLANFLRASLSNTSAKVVSLADEVKLCDDYIAMQKLRFGNALQYEINIPSTESTVGFVPSFSLQPLLENAIKHNDVTDEKPLSIKVYTANGYVVVANNLQRKKTAVVSTGNGLANLIKRYELISGDEVIIEENETSFSVRLKILKA